MDLVKSQELGFLFSGFIYRPRFHLSDFLSELESKWGKILFLSPEWNFSCHTDYYEKEMGKDLKRVFAIFDRVISPMDLVSAKLDGRRWEEAFRDKRGRQVNIDPGYVSPNKIILASTKNHYHRIYLEKGVYIELTMVYCRGAWQRLEWTYPDYYQTYRSWFQEIRRDILSLLRIRGVCR